MEGGRVTRSGEAGKAVLDTNVFVGAGFNPGSSSARLLKMVETGDLELLWTEATRRETAHILRQIPRLSWDEVEPLFRAEARFADELPLEPFGYVEDPDDRKFAALAAASGATLVTSDDHLLQHRGRSDLDIATPSQFLRRIEQGAS